MDTRFIYCKKLLGPQYEACVSVDGHPVVFPVAAQYRDKFPSDSAFHRWLERQAYALNSQKENICV